MLNAEKLEALSEVKDLFSAEKCVTISECIPTIKGIFKLVNKFEASTAISYNLKEKLSNKINNKFSNIEKVEVYAMATLLDPRYKKKRYPNYKRVF